MPVAPSESAAAGLYRVERSLRELTTEMQLEQRYPRSELSRLSDELDEIVEETLGVAEMAEKFGLITADEYDSIYKATEAAEQIVGLDMLYRIEDCEGKGIVPRECMADKWLSRALERLNGNIEVLTGRRCAYAEWTGRGGEASIAMVLNDAASCVHRLADWLSERTSDIEIERRGKCLESRDASPAVRSACEEWDRATEQLRREGLYESHDYGALEGRAIGDRLMLRVGSASGHATHLDLERGRLDYYDDDDLVNYAMAKLWEDLAGLRCSVRGDGVMCEGLTEGNIGRAAVVAAAATSMDYRIESPWRYWGREAAAEAEVERVSPLLRRK